MNPLKQGLKPLPNFYNNPRSELVRIVNPLKQGLKHMTPFSKSLNFSSKNSESIKTRIETSTNIFLLARFLKGKNSESIKTRIETSIGLIFLILVATS